MTTHDIDHSIRDELSFRVEYLGFRTQATSLSQLPPLTRSTAQAYRKMLTLMECELEVDLMPGHGDVNRHALAGIRDALTNLHEPTT